MKLKVLAAVAAIAAIVFAAAGVQAANPPAGAGPQDHSWNVTYTSTTPTTTTNVSVTLGLGNQGALVTPDTSFFHDATSAYGGIQPAASSDSPNVPLAWPKSHLGDNTGNIGFNIQTNFGGTCSSGTAGSNNICSGTGQPPECNTTGLPANVAANTTPIFGASQLGSGAGFPAGEPAATVSTEADPAFVPPGLETGAFSFDQEPDMANGGMPYGMTHQPDWYTPVTSALGISSAVIGRNMAVAKVLVARTSVNFLTVNPQNGTFISVTVLGNPAAAFSAKSQTQTTCPKFTSSVNQLGVSGSGTGGVGQYDWASCKDYEGTALTGCTNYAGASGGTNLLTVESAGAAPGAAPGIQVCNGTTTCAYKIAVSTTPDLDADGIGGGFGSHDQCPVDAGSTAQSPDNGIGTQCATGGTHWTNTTASGTSGACAVSQNAPFPACQDADQDGALNSTDNCPLVANGPLNSWLKTGSTILDNQTDNDRDGIGNACDPQPNIAGLGTGYKATTFQGTALGDAATTPAWATGSYQDFNDVCDQGFVLGGAAVTATCQVATANDQGRLDSNNDGTPDFAVDSTGKCVQDFGADSNGNGVVDGVEAGPSPLGCTGGFPGGGGKNSDPLGDQASGCFTNNGLARADMNGDGSVNGLDLSTLASRFTKLWVNATDNVAVADLNGDHFVNGLDLSVLAGNFTKSLTGNCANIAKATRKTVSGFDTYSIAWDRITGAPYAAGPNHTINMTCTGASPINATTVVVGNNGHYDISGIPTNARPTCTITFDGSTIGTFS